VNRNKFVAVWNRWREWNPFNLDQGWSRPHKAFMYAVILLLVVLLILSNTVWKSERVVERVSEGPPATTTVTDPALVASSAKLAGENDVLKAENSALKSENTALKANNNALSAENSALKSENTALKANNNALSAENAALREAVVVDPELIPKTWSSFTGSEAMKLALSTFGNIRIKVLFSEGSVPSISEATKLISQKPLDLTLSAWIGSIQQARNWPVGMATPNAGDWGTEVFLAKDSDGTVRYYYLEQITGKVVPVDKIWTANNNIYWLFIDTPALRK